MVKAKLLFMNEFIKFPTWLKKPYRFWKAPLKEANEIRSNFNIEHYIKVCESRGVKSGIEIEIG